LRPLWQSRRQVVIPSGESPVLLVSSLDVVVYGVGGATSRIRNLKKGAGRPDCLQSPVWFCIGIGTIVEYRRAVGGSGENWYSSEGHHDSILGTVLR